MTPTRNTKSNELLMALANLVVLAIIAAASTVSIIQLVNHFGPQVGDVIAFAPAKQDTRGMAGRITAMRADTSAPTQCDLDVRSMRGAGGSLAIEAMRFEPKISFRVHWAGGRTSDDQTNCGTSAELLLNQSDLAILKMAARR